MESSVKVPAQNPPINEPEGLFGESLNLSWASVPFLTVLAYAIAYCYEMGMAEFHGVPGEYIELTLTSGFHGVLGVLVYALCVSPALQIVFYAHLLRTREYPATPLNFLQLGCAIYAAGFILLAFTFGVSPTGFFYFIQLPIVMFATWAGLTWFTARSVYKSQKRLGEIFKVEAATWRDPKLLKYIIPGKSAQKTIAQVSAVLVILILTFFAGYFIARSRTDFSILNDRPFVLVGRFGETLVFRKFDEKENNFEPELLTTSAGNYDFLQLRRIKITNPTYEKRPSADPKLKDDQPALAPAT